MLAKSEKNNFPIQLERIIERNDNSEKVCQYFVEIYYLKNKKNKQKCLHVQFQLTVEAPIIKATTSVRDVMQIADPA